MPIFPKPRFRTRPMLLVAGNLAVVAAVAIALLAGLLPYSKVWATSHTIRIGSLSLMVGEQGRMELEALNMINPGLGSWILDVVYDPTVVSVVSCVASPLPGAFNDCNESFDAGTIRNVGFTGQELVGNLELASITLLCESQGTSALAVTLQELNDGTPGDPQPIVAARQDGTLTCEAGDGSLAVDPDGDQASTPLEAPDSSGSNTGLIAGIVAAIAAGAVAIGGAAWYARRRWLL